MFLKSEEFRVFNTFQSAIMWSQKPSLFKLKEQIFIHGNYYAPLFWQLTNEKKMCLAFETCPVVYWMVWFMLYANKLTGEKQNKAKFVCRNPSHGSFYSHFFVKLLKKKEGLAGWSTDCKT